MRAIHVLSSAVVTTAASMLYGNAPGLTDRFQYVSWTGDSTAEIVVQDVVGDGLDNRRGRRESNDHGNGRFILGGDSSGEARLCRRKSDLVCVIAYPAFVFGVPKDFDNDVGRTWNLDDGLSFVEESAWSHVAGLATFEVMRCGLTVSVLGTEVRDVCEIRLFGDLLDDGSLLKQTSRFLYSRKNGLIAFGRYTTFWTKAQRGFAAIDGVAR